METDNKKVVYTSVQVIEHLLPVLYVVHDDDDDWQFLSCHENGDTDGRIVSLETALILDPTLNEILWLPSGMAAFRQKVNGEWETRVHKLEE